MLTKLNWGTRIVILYSGFVALILTLVFLCMGQEVQLVSKNYYQEELQFQQRIDARSNYNLLHEKINLNIHEKTLTIQFPSSIAGVSGEILLYRPSDAHADVKFDIKLSAEGKQVISSEKIIKGQYKIQVSFKAQNKDYFFEEDAWFN